MDDFIRPEGWHNWNKKSAEKNAFYAEYECTGAGAATDKRTKWSRQLSAKQAKAYTIENVLRGDDEWCPTVTEKQ
jgi:pectinesterase